MPGGPYTCRTCAVQYPPGERPPDRCVICEDERQYVGHQGQRWATLDELRAEGVTFELRELEPGLTGLCATPPLGIGQRSLLLRTGAGNLLWDLQGHIDEQVVARVRALGGVAAISASHPHFYGCVAEWSRAFDDAPVWLPEADAAWVTRPPPALRLWSGRAEPLPGLALVQCGGHFAGSSVLHWPAGAEGHGALLTGDTIAVVADRRFVSFMRSYPNLIPLAPAALRGVLDAVAPLAFDRVYGAWWGREVLHDAKRAVLASAERYLARLQAPPPER